MLKKILAPNRVILFALASIFLYATVGGWTGYNMLVCWDKDADNGKDCFVQYALSSFFAAGLAFSISLLGVALATRELHSRTLLENTFYNTKTATLTLVFSKPVTLSNRWILTLDDVRTYLEIGIGNNIRPYAYFNQ